MDVYRIGVTIDMVNNASAVLGVVQRDVLGLHKSVEMLTSGLSAAKAAITGVGAALSSGAMLGIRGGLAREWGALVEHSRDTSTMSSTSTTGKGASIAIHPLMAGSEAVRLMFAGNSSGAPELFGGLGDTPAVQRDLVFDTKARSVAQSVSGLAIQNQSPNLMKTLQLSSAIPLDALAGADAPRGLGSSSNLLNAFKNGRAATEDWSDAFAEAVMSILSPPLRIRGDSTFAREANSRNSFFQNPSRHTTRGQQDTTADTVGSHANAHIFSSQAAQHVATGLATRHAPFEPDPSSHRSASAMGGYDTIEQSDPKGKIEAFQRTWNTLTQAMKNLTQRMAAHPELAGVIGKTSSALAELAAATSSFTVGAIAATALDFVTGSAGSGGLATGIDRLSKTLPSVPPWPMHLEGTVHGAESVPQVPGVGAVGAVGKGGTWLPGTGSANEVHTPASSIPDAISTDWMPPGGPAVPPNTAIAAPNGPMLVYVVNGREIAEGTSAHQAAQFAAPPIGPTGGDPRMTLPMPAFATIVGL